MILPSNISMLSRVSYIESMSMPLSLPSVFICLISSRPSYDVVKMDYVMHYAINDVIDAFSDYLIKLDDPLSSHGNKGSQRHQNIIAYYMDVVWYFVHFIYENMPKQGAVLD